MFNSSNFSMNKCFNVTHHSLTSQFSRTIRRCSFVAKIGKHRVTLLGEHHKDPEARKLSIELTFKAAQNHLVYFHEGVPKQEPYQKLYLNYFFHKPGLNFPSLNQLGFKEAGLNYGLETLPYFIPHCLATYYHEMAQGLESHKDNSLSDILHFKELHEPLKRFSLKVKQLNMKASSPIVQALNCPASSPLIPSEFRQIHQLVQKIQEVIEKKNFAGRLITIEELDSIKENIGEHDKEKWILLVKGLLEQLCSDLRNKELLPPKVDSSFQELIAAPKNTRVIKQWEILTDIAREEIFANRLCEIVPQQSLGRDIFVSLGNYHVAGVAQLLDQVQKKSLSKTLLPLPFVSHMSNLANK